MAGPDAMESEHTAFLDKPPCCLKFFPNFPEYFIIGTYNLISARDSVTDQAEADDGNEPAISAGFTERNGSLEVFELKHDKIVQVNSLAVEYGVLDIHIQDSILGAATSIGLFTIFKITPQIENSAPQIAPLCSLRLADPSVVLTSFAWQPTPDDFLQVIVTSSSGAIESFLLNQDPSSQDTIDQGYPSPANPATSDERDKAQERKLLYNHSLEAWIVALSPKTWVGHTTQVLTGGDDAVLACTTLEYPSDIVTWTDRRTHAAGVTAILPFPEALSFPTSNTASEESRTSECKYNIVLTGSYDDKLRVLHLPGTARPKVLHELDLGGGVWRIKLLNLETTPSSLARKVDAEKAHAHVHTATVLISAMYAGAFIVGLTFEGNASVGENTGVEDLLGVRSEILAHFAEHESMCYCAEAAPVLHENHSSDTDNSDGDGNVTDLVKRQIISCSFYDKRVCLWEWPQP